MFKFMQGLCTHVDCIYHKKKWTIKKDVQIVYIIYETFLWKARTLKQNLTEINHKQNLNIYNYSYTKLLMTQVYVLCESMLVVLGTYKLLTAIFKCAKYRSKASNIVTDYEIEYFHNC